MLAQAPLEAGDELQKKKKIETFHLHPQEQYNQFWEV